MKHTFLILIFTLLWVSMFSQTKSKWNLDISYGLNGNYFVRSYDETGGPQDKTYLYKKNFLGTIGGAEIVYTLNLNSQLSAGYFRSINKGKKEYFGSINGVNVIIRDFNLRHINNIFQVHYGRIISKHTPNFKFHVGIFMATMQQQEVAIENFSNTLILDERNYSNSNLEEAGIFTGLQNTWKIDNKFELGLKFRIYYLVSTSSFEALTLTPTLSYRL